MAAIEFIRFILVVLGVFSCFLMLDAREDVPVLVWESSSDAKSGHSFPALAKFNTNEFHDSLLKKVNNKDIVVVFVEENLSTEDFSWQDANGQSCFTNLRNLASKSDSITYLPKVHSPLHGIRSLGKWQHTPLTQDNWNHEVSHANNSILLINLSDAEEYEDRHQFLKRHDIFISKVYRELTKKYKKVAAVYTAHHASWLEDDSFPQRMRTKRQIDVEGELNSTTFYKTDNIYLFTHSVPVFNNDPLGIPISVSQVVPVDEEIIGRLIVTYDSAVVTFDFHEVPAGYWMLDEVTVAQTGQPEVKLFSNTIQAPKGFSYHCRQYTVFNTTNNVVDGTNDGQHLLFEGLQVQLFFNEAEDGVMRKFDDAYDCTSFMTIGILSGYVVIILFAIIFGIGICMIMDIKTMDRFDDPKGKTISVNATE